MTVTFPIRRILVTEDPGFPGPVLNTTRPLHGEPVDADLMGFTVLLPDDERQQDENRRLDAHLIEFVTHDQAIAETKARLAVDYPEYDLDTVDDDDLLDNWKANR